MEVFLTPNGLITEAGFLKYGVSALMEDFSVLDQMRC